MSDAPLLFLATPLHDGRVHQAYMSGVIELAHALPGRLIIGKFSGSFLPVSRDVLTAHFLRSNATHLLCVDSDIGFTAADVQKLLDAKQDFATGLYAKKTPDRLLATPLRNQRQGDLVEAHYAAAGFLLLTRSCIEQLVAAHPELSYDTPQGQTWALWSPFFEVRPYGEDAAFCKRWQRLGGKIWAHPQVVVKHYGDHAYLPVATEDGAPFEFGKLPA
jgi:hypothetical protein